MNSDNPPLLPAYPSSKFRANGFRNQGLTGTYFQNRGRQQMVWEFVRPILKEQLVLEVAKNNGNIKLTPSPFGISLTINMITIKRREL